MSTFIYMSLSSKETQIPVAMFYTPNIQTQDVTVCCKICFRIAQRSYNNTSYNFIKVLPGNKF